MPDETLQIDIFPGIRTPEGAARLRAEVEARREIDYRAAQLLRRLHDAGHLRLDVLRAHLLATGDDYATATGEAYEIFEEVSEILAARSRADHRVLAAVAGAAQ